MHHSLSPHTLEYLAYKAYQLRKLSLMATAHAGSGHVTSCFSAADIVAVLFFHAMRFDPCDPYNTTHDRFILSKGHAAPLLYAAWKEIGILSEQELLELRSFHSSLEGHPTAHFAYADASTGSLGNGLSIALGYALSARLHNTQNFVYVLLGDGEIAEGCVWEAAQLGSYYQLNKVIAFLDVNSLGQTGNTMLGFDTQTYAARFQAFGWHTLTIEGHDINQIAHAITRAQQIADKPTMIIAKTVKGYGLSEVENRNGFHGKAFPLADLPALLDTLADRFPHEAQYTPPPHKVLDCKKITPPALPRVLPPPASTYTMGDMVATRYAYGQAVTALGNANKAIVALDGDVQNSTYSELFERAHPDRFFQCFIAEQNMVNMAIGFARQGNIPFVSTFAAFFTRAHDQLRMAAIDKAHLCLIGSHAGVAVGQDGPSQMGLEDIALMRALPNSTVVYPCDATSTHALVTQIAQNPGINYLRTTRNATPVLYPPTEEFPIGGCKILYHTPQDSVCIIAAGITVFEALQAYAVLKKENIFCTVIDCYSIKPLDTTTILACVQKAGNNVITVEDHYPQGGLGEAIAYALRNHAITIECLSVQKLPHSGQPAELMAYEGINAEAIIKKARELRALK